MSKPDPFTKLRREALLGFVHTLDNSELDLSDNETFRAMIDYAVNICRMQQSEISELLGVSNATVSRWISGKVAAPTAYRRSILEALKNHARELAG